VYPNHERIHDNYRHPFFFKRWDTWLVLGHPMHLPLIFVLALMSAHRHVCTNLIAYVPPASTTSVPSTSTSHDDVKLDVPMTIPSDQLVIVVSAHYDHLGIRANGDIYYGSASLSCTIC
jgi:hypothetical protein